MKKLFIVKYKLPDYFSVSCADCEERSNHIVLFVENKIGSQFSGKTLCCKHLKETGNIFKKKWKCRCKSYYPNYIKNWDNGKNFIDGIGTKEDFKE